MRTEPPALPRRLAARGRFTPCAPVALIGLAAATAAPVRAEHTMLERVEVTAGRPATLPIAIPTTTEGITAEQIERGLNATDAEDALKYLPSLLVRRRYIGDYDHAVLATRASGTGNSARSLVYADGILLSNLLGNGASFTPRWGLVTPEEIERVDVLYGPFSAAYPGNSAGAIVDVVTRMPTRLEAHVKLQAFTQAYRLHATDERFSGHQASASLGSRAGDWSWWVNLNRLDSDAQPITFANRLVAAGTVAGDGTPVSGAVLEPNPRQQPWLLLGASNRTRTVQDHAKLKLAWDATASLRATLTLASWANAADRSAQTWLRDAAGQPVWSGTVNVAGRRYALTAADFAPSSADLLHLAQGLALQRHAGGTFDWELAASRYDYRRDRVRTPTVPMPGAAEGGAGRLTDLAGTGWTTLSARAIWRPQGRGGEHLVEAGVQRDRFTLAQRVDTTSAWRDGDAVAPLASSAGRTTLTSVWAQDSWRFAPDWRAVLGLRAERWQADRGALDGLPLGERRETHASPKLALAWTLTPAWTLKASLGRALRMPTVAELYQGSVANNTIVNNDPDLRPERSWTGEWSAERALERGTLRATLFAEHTRDALYSQTNVTVTPNVTNIQNVDAIHTTGLELAAQLDDVATKGLSLQGSLTYADSRIVRNGRFPASTGHQQPRVPRWRATVFASWAMDADWSASLGARYSGRQFGQLDNSDPNDAAYTGFSRFLVADARVQWRFAPQWRASLGVDNLTNRRYWAFHPYPQRTLHAELRWDL